MRISFLKTIAMSALFHASAAVAQQRGDLGIDANYAPAMAVAGKAWTQGGRSIEPFAAFAKAGCTTARIRVWVGDDGDSRLQYATNVAKQAKAAGLRSVVVLFLSEDWADYMKQPAPEAWQGLSDAGKAEAVEAYAERVARHFADNGIDVDAFEIGNEIDFGICGVFEEAWPNRVSLAYMSQRVWPRMVPIIKAAQAGVLKVRPGAKFVLHLTQWSNVAYCIEFWKHMLGAGVRIDFAGLSYFPSAAADEAQRSFNFLGKQIESVAAATGRPVMICETGYPAAPQFGGQFADWNKPAVGYPLSPAGQAKWAEDFAAFARGHPYVRGAFYWSPEWYGGGLWDAFAWFDERGEARPVLGLLSGVGTVSDGRQVLQPSQSQSVAASQPVATPTTAAVATRPTTQAARTLATRPTAAPAAAAARVFLGNLHAHTGSSDGSGGNAEAYAFARDVAGLDFLAITDHNHLLGGAKATPAERTALYDGTGPDAVVAAAAAAMRPGRFVSLYGQEYSSMSKGNHVNAFDVPAVIDVPNGDFAGLLKWLTTHPDTTGKPAILQLNHPALGTAPNRVSRTEFGRDDFGDDVGWVKQMGAVTSLVELLNGEPLPREPAGRAPQVMESHFRRLLRLGFRLAPTGNQDNHKKQWGTITEVRTGIVATELTKPALLAAMRERHVYASEDKNLRVIIAVNDGLCGDVLPAAGALRVSVRIDDADEFAARYTVEAFRGRVGGTNEDVVGVATIDGNTPTGQWVAIDGLSLTQPGEFLYFRVTQSSAQGVDRLWTAPVWLAAAN